MKPKNQKAEKLGIRETKELETPWADCTFVRGRVEDVGRRFWARGLLCSEQTRGAPRGPRALEVLAIPRDRSAFERCSRVSLPLCLSLRINSTELPWTRFQDSAVPCRASSRLRLSPARVSLSPGGLSTASGTPRHAKQKPKQADRVPAGTTTQLYQHSVHDIPLRSPRQPRFNNIIALECDA